MSVKGSYASNQTDAAKAGLNLKLDPIEKFVFAGFQKLFLSYFECPCIWQTTDAEDRSLNKLFNRDSGTDAKSVVPYPYAFLKVQSYAEDPSRLNLNRMAVRGLTIVPTQDTKRSYRVHLIPVDFAVNVKFVTNKYADVQQFASRWLFAKLRSYLKFNVVYGRATFTITCLPESNVSIPLPPASNEEIIEYPVEVSVIVKGFISEAVLQEQQVATSVTTEVIVGEPDDATARKATWYFPEQN